MQIPEGYKNSALGIIPNDWEVKEFGLFSKLNKSKYLPKINEHHKCLELEHISQIDGTLLGWVDSANQKSSKNVFLKGQVLFGKLRPYLRKYWFAQFDGVCSSEIWVLNSIKAFCIDEYLYRIIQSNKFIQISNVSSGSKMPRADWDYVYSFPFSLPPLPQQQKIAEILGTWDEAIEKQSKLRDKLTDRKRGLMQQLLTGKKRLAGFSEEWKEVRLGEIGERVVRKNTEKNHNVVTISAQQGFVSQKDYFNKTIASEVTDNYYLIHKDEFCYNKSYSAGYPMGAIKRLKTFDKAVVTTLYICFKLKENISKDFFEQFTEGGNLINSLVKVANEGGRAHGLLNVTPVDFFNIKFTLPSLPEQTAIANILTAADKEIELAKSKLELLRSQKSGLMQELLTGKTRV